MNEAEWLACDDPARMSGLLRGQTDPRKARLFACACVRRGWGYVTEQPCRTAVELFERAADGLATPEEVKAIDFDYITSDFAGKPAERLANMAAGHIGWNVIAPVHGLPPSYHEWRDVIGCVSDMASAVANVPGYGANDDDRRAFRLRRAIEEQAQADLLRDIFGNPFRPVAVDPAWLTPTVVALARGIYGERAFDRMPILADALQDTGCDNDDILNHCRGEGPHVRGCWVVDLLLGKE